MPKASYLFSGRVKNQWLAGLQAIAVAAVVCLSTTTAGATEASAAAAADQAPIVRTEIKDRAAYNRLLSNSGISLQWLWTDARGQVDAVNDNGVLRLTGGHSTSEGELEIDGEVVSISADRFIFRGTILILDAPDLGRRCERHGDFEFRATGKRKYWRLQQMEACDGLTDYVDIYY